jgi:ribosomal protein S18 acetylase RimI-like enzyme
MGWFSQEQCPTLDANPHVGYRLMTLADYEPVLALWRGTAGMGLRSLDDSREGIAKFLARNPNTCFIAETPDAIVGVILAGHDGRRGYIYHAVVRERFRGRGIGKALLGLAEKALKAEGINRAGLLVFAENENGNAFWEAQGWTTRPDLTYRNKSLNEENV